MKMELPLLLPILLACAACATPEPAVVPETAAMHDLPVPQLHVPRAGLVTGGQPEAVAWTVLARRGVATVVNLRPAAEMAGRDEAAEVSAAGMAYHAIPVDGAAGITLDKARALRSLLDKPPVAPAAVITSRKILAQRRYANRQNRGGGAIRGESEFGAASLNAINHNQQPPDLLAEVSDSCDQLLNALPDETMRKILLLKFQGANNGRVALVACPPVLALG